MMPENVHVTHGPPGCGKTTWIVEEAGRRAEAGGPSSVLIASLTRTAAREVRVRRARILEGRVGTLHSFAYQALGLRQDQVASMEEMPAASCLFDDPKAGGRKVAVCYSFLRSSLVPRMRWPRRVRAFAERWEAWKRERGLVDFDDMLDLALDETTCAPGRPRTLYLDECQDYSPADLRLALHWARECESLVLVGDMDQCIFGFRGAGASFFFEVPESRRRVLSQSWRLPREVHAYAMRWISKVRRRVDVEYRPLAWGCSWATA